jgi:hypothetical protein
MRRALLVALVAYAVLDFASPLIPGAVNFDDDQTILAARPVPHRGVEFAPLAAQLVRWIDAVHVDRVETHHRPVSTLAPIGRPPSQLRPSYPPASHSPDATEDH